jgi:endosialidase-like protein
MKAKRISVFRILIATFIIGLCLRPDIIAQCMDFTLADSTSSDELRFRNPARTLFIMDGKGRIGIPNLKTDAAFYIQRDSPDGNIFEINTNARNGILINNASPDGYGILARNPASTGDAVGVYGETNSPDGYGIIGKNPRTTGTGSGILGETNSPDGHGVIGKNPQTTGAGSGLYGETNSPGGYGILGRNPASTGDAVGVYGETNSPDGHGIIGKNPRTTGTGSGILGETNSPDGHGVIGKNPQTTGTGSGIYGETNSPGGHGIIGKNPRTTGTGSGILGETNSPDGHGVIGKNPQTTGAGSGLYGETNSPDGYGILGRNPASTGDAAGVYGETNSPDGHGIIGKNPRTTGAGSGLYGETSSPDGHGILGKNPRTTGSGSGILGETNSPDGYGIIGRNPSKTGNATGVYGETYSSSGIAVVGQNHMMSSSGRLAAGIHGVYGQANESTGYAVYGSHTGGGFAGYFNGNAMFTGDVNVNGHIYQNWGGYYRLQIDTGNNNAYFVAPSDRRLKRDIAILPNALSQVQRLRGVTYHWNEKGLVYHIKDIEKTWKSTTGSVEDDRALWAKKRAETVSEITGLKIGFVAQELEEVFPQWVREEDGIKKIDTKELDAVLVEAVKELHHIVQKQNERIMKLERELANHRKAPKDSKFSNSFQTK